MHVTTLMWVTLNLFIRKSSKNAYKILLWNLVMHGHDCESVNWIEVAQNLFLLQLLWWPWWASRWIAISVECASPAEGRLCLVCGSEGDKHLSMINLFTLVLVTLIHWPLVLCWIITWVGAPIASGPGRAQITGVAWHSSVVLQSVQEALGVACSLQGAMKTQSHPSDVFLLRTWPTGFFPNLVK
jgi:hypothetical protein